MKITIPCTDIQVKHGDVTLNAITATELVMALDATDTGLVEVLEAIGLLKGKEFLGELNENDTTHQ